MKKTLLLVLAVLAAHVFAQTDLTVPDGTITCCASHGSYPGTKAFDDGGAGDGSRWLANAGALPDAWVCYEFPTATCVGGYKIFGFAPTHGGLARDPKAWTFEGSNDGAAWTLLDTRTGQVDWTSFETRTFYFDNDDSYTHYKFTITANNGATDYTGVLELEFYGSPNIPGVPVVAAKTATSTGAATATLDAELQVGGVSDLTFFWGTSPGVWTDSLTFEDVAPVFCSADIADLEPYQTYYWTVHAENAYGSAWASSTNVFVSWTGPDITRPDGIISGSSTHSKYGVEKVFDDGDLTDSSRWLSDAANLPNAYVQYQFADGPYLLKAYRTTALINYLDRNPREWTILGSTNGTDWTVIDTQAGQTGWTGGEQRMFAVTAASTYDHYRFNIVANNGATDYSGLNELELFGLPAYVEPPDLASEGVEQTAKGTVTLKGRLLAGGSAEVFAAWGDSPGNLSNTNAIDTVFTGTFGIPLSGLTVYQTYYYTIVAVNSEGRAELEGAPLSFVAESDQFTWIGASGNWEDASNWSQGVRSPDAPGDMVFVNTIRTLALNAPSATLGGLTLSGPYASGPVVITNANPNARLVFDNPGGEAIINADVGGRASYRIWPDLVLNEDVSVSATEAWPVSLFGGVTGPGRLVQQPGARIHLAPAKDIVLDGKLAALSNTSYLSIGGSGSTTLRGANTVAFWGTWAENSALSTGARLVLDGEGTVVSNITTSSRASWTYSGHHDASLTIKNGARMVTSSSASGPIFNGYRNRATITGAGSAWDFNNADVRIAGTSNQLVVAQGGAVDKAHLTVRGSRASITISGTDTLWNADGNVCIGLGGNDNAAEISNGAVVTNCLLLVAGRHGYDSAKGGSGNSVVVSGGAKVHSTKNQGLSDGGGVGVTGDASLLTDDNTLRVTGEGSALILGDCNFSIGHMQAANATGRWNRVAVEDGGVITNVPNLYVGRVSGTTQESWSNSLVAASGGAVWVRNSIDVGDARSTGNRIVMAGGRIAAKTLNVKTGNGISAVLDHTAPVPATFETRATFEAGTTVWPLLADGVHDGVGGVILTAPEIIDDGLELSPDADPAWRLVKTPTSIALTFNEPRTVITVR